jgi:hypothetical protein
MTDETSPASETSDCWRSRAEEARAIAEQMKDPESRRGMLDIAAAYYRMALQAEARRCHQRRDQEFKLIHYRADTTSFRAEFVLLRRAHGPE